MDLSHKSVIISGASQGFGYAVAQEFIKRGAHVVICARNENLLQCALDELKKIASNQQKVIAIAADVSKPGDFDKVVSEALEQIGYIDGLVANAGVYGAMGPIDEVDWEEWSNAIDINLKGTVLQCRAVVPHFKSRKRGKIVILSGGGATQPKPYLSSYAAAKAAVVRFGETLAEELISYNIDVNSVAPGSLNTRLLEEVIEAGPKKVGEEFYHHSLKQKESGGVPLEIGANLCAFLVSSASNGITGKLISAKWDPWENFPQYIEALRSSDIYTLRRIVPEDRSMVLGDAK